MQLLIAHNDAEVGEQLMSMVKEYTTHQCSLVQSGSAADCWAREHDRCGLLLTQLDGTDLDGLLLGGLLGETFPGLQTLFLPAYSAADQQVEIEATKVFPEPIDGERLLEAIERVNEPKPETPDLFHVLDLLQMLCLSRRRGAIQVVQPNRNAIVYLRDGRIVHAEGAVATGFDALLEIVGWGRVEFAYDPSLEAAETLSMPWDELLVQAIARHEKKNLQIRTSLPRSGVATGTPTPKKRGLLSALRWL